MSMKVKRGLGLLVVAVLGFVLAVVGLEVGAKLDGSPAQWVPLIAALIGLVALVGGALAGLVLLAWGLLAPERR